MSNKFRRIALCDLLRQFAKAWVSSVEMKNFSAMNGKVPIGLGKNLKFRSIKFPHKPLPRDCHFDQREKSHSKTQKELLVFGCNFLKYKLFRRGWPNLYYVISPSSK